jgi:flagellar basal body-associated protein FliL
MTKEFGSRTLSKSNEHQVSVDSFTQLFEVKSTDVNYLKNKVIELKAMADIDRQLLEKVANQPIVKVVMEWGSVIIKFVIVNPSDSATQKIPFKAFLPKEVKQEYIMDLGGLTLNYDTTTEQYYVTADITLEKGSAVTRSVEIKDIWIISEDEVASLRKQAEELSSGLKNTSYFAQGLTLKTDINTRLDKVARKQKDNNSTPQDHILAYRENVEDMKAVNDNIKGLKDLVLNSGVGGNFLASIGGIQTFATWGIILVLIFGMGALGSFYYVLWKRKVVSVAVGKGKKMKDVELPTPTPFALPGFRFTWLKGILLGWKALLTDIFSALFHVGGTMAVHSNTVVAMARSMPKKTLVILLIAGLVTVTTVGGVIVARNASGRDQKQVAGAFTNGSVPTPTVASTKAEKVNVLVSEMIKKAEERKKVNAKIIELLKKTENEATASALPVATKSPSSTQKPTPTVMQNNIQGVVEVIKNPPEAVVIRDKPDKKALVIAKADAGKDYSFTAKVGEWYQIVQISADKKEQSGE